MCRAKELNRTLSETKMVRVNSCWRQMRSLLYCELILMAYIYYVCYLLPGDSNSISYCCIIIKFTCNPYDSTNNRKKLNTVGGEHIANLGWDFSWTDPVQVFCREPEFLSATAWYVQMTGFHCIPPKPLVIIVFPLPLLRDFLILGMNREQLDEYRRRRRRNGRKGGGRERGRRRKLHNVGKVK